MNTARCSGCGHFAPEHYGWCTPALVASGRRGVEPLRPEHADRESTPPGVERRVSVRRRLVDYAYPRNGNVHNPTPRYAWDLLVDGRAVDTFTRRRDAVLWARSWTADALLAGVTS